MEQQEAIFVRKSQPAAFEPGISGLSRVISQSNERRSAMDRARRTHCYQGEVIGSDLQDINKWAHRQAPGSMASS
jgi:hypothetical protein